MRTHVLCLLCGVVLTLAIVALSGAAPAGKAGPSWEYKFVHTESQPSGGADRLGAEGWELVSATADAGQYYLYFKRPK